MGKNQNKKKFNIFDTLDSPLASGVVAGLCIAGLAICMIIFGADMHKALRRDAELPAGKISWKTGTLQRQSERRGDWDRLGAYSPVYFGDKISAAAFSGAWIDFANGEMLELSANTTIRIVRRDDGISHAEIIEGNVTSGERLFSRGPAPLSPADGEVFFTSSRSTAVHFSWALPDEISSVVLEIADNRFMIDPIASRTLDRRHLGAFSCPDLSAGTWYWRLLPQQAGRSSPSSDIRTFTISQVEELQPPLPLGPADYAVLSASAAVIPFSWKPQQGAASYTLEISFSPDMRNPHLSRTVKDNFFLYRPEENLIDRGTWYWNVYATNDQGRQSPPSRMLSFTLENTDNAPRTIFPPDNFTIPSNRSQDIYFCWESTLPDFAHLQIVERPDFSNPLVDTPVYGSGAQGPFLYPGTYYWRIATGSGTSARSSSPSRLVILPALTAPAIESPSDYASVQILEGAPLLFSWHRETYADYYQFRLYVEGRDASLCEITLLRDNRLFVHFDPKTVGQFRWTVQAFVSATDESSMRAGMIRTGRFNILGEGLAAQIAQGGAGIGWSIPRIANMQSFSGEVRASITLLEPPTGITLNGLTALRTPPIARWSSDEPLSNTQLIVSHRTDPIGDPRAIVVNAGRSNSVRFPMLESGIWYWTIRADTIGERGVSSGDPFWLNVLPLPLFPAPLGAKPAEGENITLTRLTADKSIVFSWDMVPGASGYIFSLYADTNPPELIYAGEPVNSTTFVLDNLSLLQYDSYKWQVEAVSLTATGALDQRGVIEQHIFSLGIEQSANMQTRTQEGPLYGQ